MYFFAERKDRRFEAINAYTYKTFPYDNVSRKTLSHGKKAYKKTFSTFDIESTSTILDGEPYGFMYIWQMCVGGICVYGRTWGEWVLFLQNLKKAMRFSDNSPMIIYVHNLAFEYQFIYQILDTYFEGAEVFSTSRRKPLSVRSPYGIEFRCSYKLSNMSLNKATTTEHGCLYIKADGDLDYDIKRYPSTPLTDIEFSYCMNDVLSLYYYIEMKLLNDNDTLLTIPLTSTGYVRRDCRNECKKDKTYMNLYQKNRLVPAVYELLKEAGRGGDTGANRYLAGQLIDNVDSFDVTSSYPYVMLTQYYPVTKFYPYGEVENEQELDDICKHRCVLFRICFTNLRLKHTSVDAYLPLSKALAIEGKRRVANGRILSAQRIIYTLTEIDWEIVKDLYDYDSISISSIYTAKRGELPNALKRVILYYFRKKCELSIQRDHAKAIGDLVSYELFSYLYMKIKNKLNGIFGMIYTDPVRDEIDVNDGEWNVILADIKKSLKQYEDGKNNFLVYAWGVWTTAHARFHLQTLLHLTGDETIYWDTDSSKARITPYHLRLIEEENKRIIEICKEKGAYVKIDNAVFYLGTYEHETKNASYKNFKTLGAKKYAYTNSEGKLKCTISGVAKSNSLLHPDGARELGDISNFKLGFTFREAGGLTLYYVKKPLEKRYIDGHEVYTGSGIATQQSTYTIGITKEYAEILDYYDQNML